MQILLRSSIVSILFISSTISSAAQAEESKGALAFYVENDTRNIGGPGSDQAYTNGLKASYVYSPDTVPAWSKLPLKTLSLISPDSLGSEVNFESSLGHQLYTPNDTQSYQLNNFDRPYVAWLNVGLAVSATKKPTEENFVEVNLGIVGPSALGKEVQNNFHDLIHEPGANGWNNTIHDEPTLQIFYQHRQKAFIAENFDVIPFYGAAVGNALIAAHAGGTLRYGVKLPDNFGPSRPSASDGNSFVRPKRSMNQNQNSYFVFAGGRANSIARSIFLDGNSFQSSPRVSKYSFTFETEFGAGIEQKTFAVIWSFVTRSPEFKERSAFSSFASLNLTLFL